MVSGFMEKDGTHWTKIRIDKLEQLKEINRKLNDNMIMIRNEDDRIIKLRDEEIEQLKKENNRRFGGIRLLEEARKEIKRLEIVILKGRELCNTYEDSIEEQNHKIKLVERYIDSLKCYSDECLGCENDIIRDITKTILNSHTCDSLKCEQDES